MATTNGERTVDATLGAQVRAARASKGLTLRSLARALDVSPATLSQIENGRTGLTVHRLSRIADALDLTPAESWTPLSPPPPRRTRTDSRRHHACRQPHALA